MKGSTVTQADLGARSDVAVRLPETARLRSLA